MLERRKSTRYELRVPVAFSWIDSTGTRHQNSGFTLNVSPLGIFVLCPESIPPVHCDVMLEVIIPPLHENRPGVRLKSGGRVLRVEKIPGRVGFAAAANFKLSEENVQ